MLGRKEEHCCAGAALCRHLVEIAGAGIAGCSRHSIAAAGCTADSSCLVHLHLDHMAAGPGTAGSIQLHRVHRMPDLAAESIGRNLVAAVLAGLVLERLAERSCLLRH